MQAIHWLAVSYDNLECYTQVATSKTNYSE